MTDFTKEQRFIVTGASSGIGKEVALLLNKEGASVIGIGRNLERLEEMKNQSSRPENIFIEQKDLTEDIGNLPEYVKKLKDKYGRLQGLAYCAGISTIQPLRAIEFEKIRKIFDINYFAPVFMAKGLADKRVNNGKGSAMVFIASSAGIYSDPGKCEYAGSKGALISSMRSVGRELARFRIRVNCVSPSMIDSPLTSELSRAYAEGKYPMGLGQPRYVANLIAFLLSDKSSWVSAQNYIIDSGGAL